MDRLLRSVTPRRCLLAVAVFTCSMQAGTVSAARYKCPEESELRFNSLMAAYEGAPNPLLAEVPGQIIALEAARSGEIGYGEARVDLEQAAALIRQEGLLPGEYDALPEVEQLEALYIVGSCVGCPPTTELCDSSSVVSPAPPFSVQALAKDGSEVPTVEGDCLQGNDEANKARALAILEEYFDVSLLGGDVDTSTYTHRWWDPFYCSCMATVTATPIEHNPSDFEIEIIEAPDFSAKGQGMIRFRVIDNWSQPAPDAVDSPVEGTALVDIAPPCWTDFRISSYEEYLDPQKGEVGIWVRFCAISPYLGCYTWENVTRAQSCVGEPGDTDQTDSSERVQSKEIAECGTIGTYSDQQAITYFDWAQNCYYEANPSPAFPNASFTFPCEYTMEQEIWASCYPFAEDPGGRVITHLTGRLVLDYSRRPDSSIRCEDGVPVMNMKFYSGATAQPSDQAFVGERDFLLPTNCGQLLLERGIQCSE